MSSASSLTEVAVYRRRVGASLQRVWENVLDWEHLPWLHRSSFSSIEPLEIRSDGWRARVEILLGDESVSAVIDLRTERDKNRYLTATIDGVGAGTEIWTVLDPVGAHETAIEVSFRIPDVTPDRVDATGDYFRTLYARLWDEDEAMMRRRAAMLARRTHPRSQRAEVLELGSRAEVLRRVPFEAELGGHRYRIVVDDGEILAHSTLCPHALGPLDEGELCKGRVRCPWHGYEFDIRSGASCDGRALRLRTAPQVRDEDGRLFLELAGSQSD